MRITARGSNEYNPPPPPVALHPVRATYPQVDPPSGSSLPRPPPSPRSAIFQWAQCSPELRTRRSSSRAARRSLFRWAVAEKPISTALKTLKQTHCQGDQEGETAGRRASGGWCNMRDTGQVIPNADLCIQGESKRTFLCGYRWPNL